MFDENAAEFAFMEQDAIDGLAKSFDKFVDNIDKVKSSLEGLRDNKEMGYNDFYNIIIINYPDRNHQASHQV